MFIRIYTQENEDDIVVIKDHSLDNYLQVYTSNHFLGI